MVTATTRRPGSAHGREAPPRTGPFTRWPRISDATLAALAFIAEVIGIVIQSANETGRFRLGLVADVPLGVYLLLAVSSVALFWRRRHPLPVLTVTLAASVMWDMLAYDLGPSLAILISLYGAGRYLDESRTSVLSLGVAMVVAVADDLLEGEDAPVIGLSLALVFGAWYLGRRAKSRREYLALLEERAEYLERERVAQVEQAAAEERTRIARELHDLVAHRVSMITVQAGAAQTVAGTDPARAMRAMEAVEVAGREALDELRQVLGVLRSDDVSGGLAPSLGLRDVPGLVADMQDAGVDVSFHTEGVERGVPARVDLAAYRIVQEALTNVLKHAGPDAGAKVRIAVDDRALTIEVTDRGSGSTTLPGSGNGLVGMRERASSLGGEFAAGPRPEGGFQIRARLPFEWSAS